MAHKQRCLRCLQGGQGSRLLLCSPIPSGPCYPPIREHGRPVALPKPPSIRLFESQLNSPCRISLSRPLPPLQIGIRKGCEDYSGENFNSDLLMGRAPTCASMPGECPAGFHRVDVYNRGHLPFPASFVCDECPAGVCPGAPLARSIARSLVRSFGRTRGAF